MADLLDTLRSNGVNDLLPADLADRLSQLGIDNVTTSTNGDVTVIRGTVRPLTDRGLPQLGMLPIEAPGINGGLRAQLAVRRNGSGQVTQWAVDLDLDRLAIAVPGLRPAREVREPARATRLADEPSRRDVRIVGRGVLRIAAAGGAAPEVTLIDALDATTPFGDHGALAALTFEPPSFFIGSSAFGFTVDQVTYDQSTNLSPSPKPPDWRGIALRRATFYLPPGAPVVGDVSVGVEDVFLGDPVGVEGTATLEFGGAAINTPPTLVVEIEGSGGTWTAIATTSLDPSPGLRQDRFNAQLPGARPPAAHVRGRLSPAPAGSPTITWRLNGENVAASGFDVLPGDTLEVTIGNTPPIVCTFTGTWSAAPTVDLQIGAGRWVNTASVSGGSTALGAAAFGTFDGNGRRDLHVEVGPGQPRHGRRLPPADVAAHRREPPAHAPRGGQDGTPRARRRARRHHRADARGLRRRGVRRGRHRHGRGGDGRRRRRHLPAPALARRGQARPRPPCGRRHRRCRRGRREPDRRGDHRQDGFRQPRSPVRRPVTSSARRTCSSCYDSDELSPRATGLVDNGVSRHQGAAE